MMPKAVVHAKIDTPAGRSKLKSGRQPHWQAIGKNAHVGYRRPGKKTEGKKPPEGTWLLRRYLGGGNSYRITALGTADDVKAANGTSVLSHAQAMAKARAMIETPDGDKIHRITVRQAFDNYVTFKRQQGQSVADVEGRGTAHILPILGDLVVAELTAERLRRWLDAMATGPAQVRPKQGKVQYRPEPVGEEAIRKRRATANRVLTMLKAMLNFAFDEGHVSNRDAWGRKLKPFHGADAARIRYLSIPEAQRLLNACDPIFLPLARAALETGCRYSELTRLDISDFNPDAGAIAIRKSKSGKSRHVILTEDGAEFFRTHCAGKTGAQIMFTTGQGERWKKDEQKRFISDACSRAKIEPRVSIHVLRHTWASHAVMNGVPLLVVAKNLGHAGTVMVERHYGHLAPSYIVDAIRAGAPKFGIEPDRKVVRII